MTFSLSNKKLSYKVTDCDHRMVDMIDDAACNTGTTVGTTPTAAGTSAGQVRTWNTRIQIGQDWDSKKKEFNNFIEMANVAIINKTLRANATFILAANNVAAVIRQLPNFKTTATGKTPPTGPYKMGTLDNRTVIHDPFLGDKAIGSQSLVAGEGQNRYIVGYKGDGIVQTGAVFCPYIPLMATQTLTTADLFVQKGFLSSCGFAVPNPGVYACGLIEGLGQYGYADGTSNY